MGCHSPSPTVPSSLFASFPFLTEKEARGSPRNGNYRRNLFCETLGKEAGKLIPEQGGEADGCVGLESQVLHHFFCSCCPVMEWMGEMIRQHDRRTAQVNQWTASQAKGGKNHSFFTLTPRLSFHFENGILIKWELEKKYTGKLEMADTKGITVFKCLFIFWPQRISCYISKSPHEEH